MVRRGIEKTLRGAAAVGKAGDGAEQRPLVEDPRAAVRMQRADGRVSRPPALLIFVLCAPYARALRSLRTGRFAMCTRSGRRLTRAAALPATLVAGF